MPTKKKLHIIKIGGKLINDQHELDKLLDAFNHLDGFKILIHGGGRKATELSKQMGLEVKMVEGRRITDQATLEIAVMVYAGLINKSITALLQAKGTNAIGLCGADGDIIKAYRRPVKEIDYGWVGDIDSINVDQIKLFLDNDLTPIFSAISHDTKGNLLNTNADTIASSIAQAMSKYFEVSLKYCFEFQGVLHNIDHVDDTIDIITKDLFYSMKEDGTINTGMIPKLSNGFDALRGGAKNVFICGIENLTTLDNATTLSL